MPAQEYETDELINFLAAHGPGLLTKHFIPSGDLESLIRRSVGGNTFRALHHTIPKPSAVFRGWANRELSFATMADLGELATQADFDAALQRMRNRLSRHWESETGKSLPFGLLYKLINLLFKEIVRCTEIGSDGRSRLIEFLHVPNDEYSLLAIRRTAAAATHGPLLVLPKKPTVKTIQSLADYNAFQTVVKNVTSAAKLPPITFDLFAWNRPHAD